MGVLEFIEAIARLVDHMNFIPFPEGDFQPDLGKARLKQINDEIKQL